MKKLWIWNLFLICVLIGTFLSYETLADFFGHYGTTILLSLLTLITGIAIILLTIWEYTKE